MTDMRDDSAPAIPTFCVIGQPNQGKTTLMSTLIENDFLAVSPIPGTTTNATEYPRIIDGERVMTLWDTPGFENTKKAHAWFEDHSELPNPAADFIERFKNEREFRAECEVFKPIAEGAAIIYIVDASQKVRTTDKEQVDILRRCGNPRIAVIFSKDGKDQHYEEWRRLLTRDFNHRHAFNAHTAKFEDKINLLKAVRTIIPEWQKAMDRTINALEHNWRAKENEAIDCVMKLIKSLLSVKAELAIDQYEERDRIQQRVEDNLREKVLELENKYRKTIREVYGHSQDYWILDSLVVDDLFSEEVWKTLGMTRSQLMWFGASVGAASGLTIDVLTGGAAMGVPTALLTVGGAGFAYLNADRFAAITLPPLFRGGGRIAGIPIPEISPKKRTLGGGVATAQVAPQSKLVGIVLDRALIYLSQTRDWAHGNRIAGQVKVEGDESSPMLTRNWPQTEQKALGTFVGCVSGKITDRDRIEESAVKMREVIREKLSESQSDQD
ncbi:MAG: GTPase/DUF3482 domain-containing protein [Verrucomicrobiota bacterium]